MQRQLGALIIGMLMIVIGLVLAIPVIAQATTAGANANIGSFSGAQSVNDLIPLLWFVVVVMVGVGLVGLAGAGFVGKGPLQ